MIGKLGMQSCEVKEKVQQVDIRGQGDITQGPQSEKYKSEKKLIRKVKEIQWLKTIPSSSMGLEISRSSHCWLKEVKSETIGIQGSANSSRSTLRGRQTCILYERGCKCKQVNSQRGKYVRNTLSPFPHSEWEISGKNLYPHPKNRNCILSSRHWNTLF